MKLKYIRSKFPTNCASCNEPIKAKQGVLWNPDNHKVWSYPCGCAERIMHTSGVEICIECNERPADTMNKCMRCYMRDRNADKAEKKIKQATDPKPEPSVKTDPSPSTEPKSSGSGHATVAEAVNAFSAMFQNMLANMESFKGDSSEDIKRIERLAEKAANDVSAVKELVDKVRPVVHHISTNGQEPVKLEGLYHKDFPKLLNLLELEENVFMVGPSGSGKTHLGIQLAEHRKTPFYYTGAVLQKYELIGFQTANGTLVRTPFRESYEHGGDFMFDELDSSNPEAINAFNAALDNKICAFPDGMIKMHPNFRCIAAGNTYGRGADRVYSGRNQLDGASLERFIFWTLDYDETLERNLAGNDDWTSKVQAWRKGMEKEKVRHIISPRASIKGAKLLANGFTEKEVEHMVVWKGLPQEQIDKCKRNAPIY